MGNIFKRFIESFIDDGSSYDIHGKKVSDKRDIDDPTGKFSTPVHRPFATTTTYRKSDYVSKNVNYFKPEYDLPTVANAIQLDGLIKRIVSLYVEHIFKNDYEITSKNDRLHNHLKRRIKEIEHLTGIPFRKTLTTLATQLVSYGNAYLIKKRSRDKSRYGNKYRLYGKTHNPITGLFIVDATTMEIGLDQNGNLKSYKQRIGGNSIEWDERDVIHFTYDRIPGTLVGTSPILPIIDDLRALRKLEEEVEILGFQYSLPLYIYKVGNKDVPPAPGEVDDTAATVNNMPAYGMLVVPGHHDVSVPDNSNDTIDIIKYIDHFKSRIFGALGVSSVAMGESDTSNRNTSEVGDALMQSRVISYQNIFKSDLELGLLRELALDGKFNEYSNYEFRFSEIDIENQIKKESHIVQLWQNNLITREEARLKMDQEIKVNESDLYINQVDIPKINAEVKAKAGLMDTNKKEIDNKVRPENQHGKTSGRPKYVKNFVNHLTMFNSDKVSDDIFEKLRNRLEEKLKKDISYLTERYNINKIPEEIIDDNVNQYLRSFSIILKNKIYKCSQNLQDEAKLKILNNNTKDFIDQQNDKLFNLSIILLSKSVGYKTILITSDNCSKHSKRNLNVNNIRYNTIPPLGYNCKCVVEFPKG